MIDMMEVIQKLRPDAQVSVTDYADGTHKITWHDDGQDEPTEADISAMRAQMEAEQPWVQIRAARNIRLRDSDWRMSNDSPLSGAEQVAWGEYREGLRNIPQDFSTPKKFGWPKNPKWPIAPE